MPRKTETAKPRAAKPKGSAPKSAGGRPPKYDWSSIRRESIFTPTSDFVLTSLRDVAPNGPFRAAVWEVGVMAAPFAVGSAVTPADGKAYTSLFPEHVTLSAGKSYLIGTYVTAGGPLFPGSDNSVETTYPGFAVSMETHYPGGAANSYPGPTIGYNAITSTRRPSISSASQSATRKARCSRSTR